MAVIKISDNKTLPPVIKITNGLGINVRHSASAQMQLGKKVKKPLPGDLVGWGWGRYFHHIGIYVGDGKVIDALNPYRDTYVRDLDTLNSWLGKPTFRRVIEENRQFNPDQITRLRIQFGETVKIGL